MPRRAIETWIHFFMSGPPVDEPTSYPHLQGHEADAEPAAVAFARHAKDPALDGQASPLVIGEPQPPPPSC